MLLNKNNEMISSRWAATHFDMKEEVWHEAPLANRNVCAIKCVCTRVGMFGFQVWVFRWRFRALEAFWRHRRAAVLCSPLFPLELTWRVCTEQNKQQLWQFDGFHQRPLANPFSFSFLLNCQKCPLYRSSIISLDERWWADGKTLECEGRKNDNICPAVDVTGWRSHREQKLLRKHTKPQHHFDLHYKSRCDYKSQIYLCSGPPGSHRSGLDVYADLAWQQQTLLRARSSYRRRSARHGSLAHRSAAGAMNRLRVSWRSITDDGLTVLWQANWIDSSSRLFIFASLASLLHGRDASRWRCSNSRSTNHPHPEINQAISVSEQLTLTK